MEERTEWVKCPECGNKTRIKVRKDTILKRFPLFCPKCKQETLIEIENLLVKIVKEPDAKTQRRVVTAADAEQTTCRK